ncbi:L domain-like protein [Anaeromyces robustus]|uniref:L domain-like protein n=1 Tax=Anaeromyces robustus TaxID=1754192 RepID=A0A1Y1WYA8_9FUNG|nr:L domain-like protein [Anaeromyces robustus]|eukprot:ORX78531.1 L domain-like protein [Anaeromyces robustus]
MNLFKRNNYYVDETNKRYFYENSRRNVNSKKELKNGRVSIKQNIKKKAYNSRKRYGQNGKKKRVLNKREVSNKANSKNIYSKYSKQQKSLNKFKHKNRNKNLKSIDNSNNYKTKIDNKSKLAKNYNYLSNDLLISNSTGNDTSDECVKILKIMEGWGMDTSWAYIDLSEEEYYDETNISKFRCCYNNNNVICKNNTIIELNFEENDIEGEIPDEICDLQDLEKLFLGTNRFYGKIPENIGNLKNLKYLWLYYNNLNDTIPSSIGNLSNLISLNLHGNQIFGEIPEAIGNLSKLETLDLHSNKLHGEIPENLNKLSKLERLYLNDNNLKITNVSFIPTNSLEICNFYQNDMTQSDYKKLKESLSCSSAFSNISPISLNGILLLLIINLFLIYKSHIF